MSQSGTDQYACSECNTALKPNMRRCPQCGAWVRPWSTGGVPSTWSKYQVGGAIGKPTDAGGSAWVPYGERKDRVRQVGLGGEAAPSGAHAAKKRGRRPKSG